MSPLNQLKQLCPLFLINVALKAFFFAREVLPGSKIFGLDWVGPPGAFFFCSRKPPEEEIFGLDWIGLDFNVFFEPCSREDLSFYIWLCPGSEMWHTYGLHLGTKHFFLYAQVHIGQALRDP